MHSYLSDRAQFVSMVGCRSPAITTNSRVPQGSVRGPLLFSIFTTLGNWIISFGIGYHQYADDIQLYTTVDDTPGSIENLSACADAVSGWNIRNKLLFLLNATKTEVLVAGTRQQVVKFYQSSGITISNTTV